MARLRGLVPSVAWQDTCTKQRVVDAAAEYIQRLRDDLAQAQSAVDSFAASRSALAAAAAAAAGAGGGGSAAAAGAAEAEAAALSVERSIEQAGGSLVFVRDAAGNLLFANREVVDFVGGTLAGLINGGFQDTNAVDAMQLVRWAQEDARVAASGLPLSRGEDYVALQFGQVRRVRSTKLPVCLCGQRLVLYVLTPVSEGPAAEAGLPGRGATEGGELKPRASGGEDGAKERHNALVTQQMLFWEGVARLVGRVPAEAFQEVTRTPMASRESVFAVASVLARLASYREAVEARGSVDLHARARGSVASLLKSQTQDMDLTSMAHLVPLNTAYIHHTRRAHEAALAVARLLGQAGTPIIPQDAAGDAAGAPDSGLSLLCLLSDCGHSQTGLLGGGGQAPGHQQRGDAGEEHHHHAEGRQPSQAFFGSSRPSEWVRTALTFHSAFNGGDAEARDVLEVLLAHCEGEERRLYAELEQTFCLPGTGCDAEQCLREHHTQRVRDVLNQGLAASNLDYAQYRASLFGMMQAAFELMEDCIIRLERAVTPRVMAETIVRVTEEHGQSQHEAGGAGAARPGTLRDRDGAVPESFLRRPMYVMEHSALAKEPAEPPAKKRKERQPEQSDTLLAPKCE